MNPYSSHIQWERIEANPDLFNDLTKKLGANQNVVFSDVLGLEPWAADMMPKPLQAIILCFPTDSEETKKEEVEIPKGLWFTHQTATNACGTIAIYHALLNLQDQLPLEPTGILKKFFDETENLTPEERAKKFAGEEEVAKLVTNASNDFTPPAVKALFDDAIHFAAFVKFGGNLYEMDGRKPAPVCHGPVSESDFFERVCDVIKKEFIAKKPNEERFTVLGLSGEA